MNDGSPFAAPTAHVDLVAIVEAVQLAVPRARTRSHSKESVGAGIETDHDAVGAGIKIRGFDDDRNDGAWAWLSGNRGGHDRGSKRNPKPRCPIHTSCPVIARSMRSRSESIMAPSRLEIA